MVTDHLERMANEEYKFLFFTLLVVFPQLIHEFKIFLVPNPIAFKRITGTSGRNINIKIEVRNLALIPHVKDFVINHWKTVSNLFETGDTHVLDIVVHVKDRQAHRMMYFHKG